ncbi:hypothetical protein AB0D90_21455 [Streptomyces althioticus]|uniref:hypothetical protein n=1 Tax=Streptomyces althioticus TaxID=83380 RepID=UPI0033E6F40D
MPRIDSLPAFDNGHEDTEQPTRRHRLRMAAIGAPLVLAPLTTLYIAFLNAKDARVIVDASNAASSAAVSGVEGAVTGYSVALDVTATDRLLFALPALSCTVALALLVWAVWRVRRDLENAEARFTKAGTKRLTFTSLAALVIGAAGMQVNVLIPRWLSGVSDPDAVLVSTTVPIAWACFPAALVAASFATTYAQAKDAFDRQVDVV